MLFMTTHASPKMTRGAAGHNKKERNLNIEMERVGDYVIQALQGTVASPFYIFLLGLDRSLLTLFCADHVISTSGKEAIWNRVCLAATNNMVVNQLPSRNNLRHSILTCPGRFTFSACSGCDAGTCYPDRVVISSKAYCNRVCVAFMSREFDEFLYLKPFISAIFPSASMMAAHNATSI